MTKAVKILSEKRLTPGAGIAEIHVWGLPVPVPVPPCTHPFKYSLFFGRPGERLIGYDNERGKGDHKHILGVEQPYVFVSVRQLVEDFRADVRTYCGVEL